MRARRVLSALLVGAAIVGGCGSDDRAQPGTPPWTTAPLDGVPSPSGISSRGPDLFLVSGDDERRLFHVRAADLIAGRSVPSRALPLMTLRSRPLSAEGELARQGYRLGDFWELPLDLTGVVVRPDGEVHLADRAYRIVYTGRLIREGATFTGALLEQAAALPLADRSGAQALDFRDRGPGLAGLSEAGEGGFAEVALVAVDRSGPAAGGLRWQALDRRGHAVATMQVEVPEAGALDVGGIAHRDGTFLVLEGTHPGRLLRVRPTARPGERVEGVWPCPEPDGAGPWRGVTLLADGTVVLVSAGPSPALAWGRLE